MEKIIYIQAKLTEDLTKPNSQKLAGVGGSEVPLRQRIFFINTQTYMKFLRLPNSIPEVSLQCVPGFPLVYLEDVLTSDTLAKKQVRMKIRNEQ